ncbi:Protein of unknown function [Gryllus bimaculatus]|nr:Protein of unknown function [Gryllus bimaculatus]
MVRSLAQWTKTLSFPARISPHKTNAAPPPTCEGVFRNAPVASHEERQRPPGYEWMVPRRGITCPGERRVMRTQIPCVRLGPLVAAASQLPESK